MLKEKLSTHHGHWKESILAHNIVDIRHRPGIDNPVTDGLSRMWANKKHTSTDRSSWSVLPDWEASHGIQNDILVVQVSGDTAEPTAQTNIEERFGGDAFFEPVVRHLLGRDTGATISERRRAMHRSRGFFIEKDDLWRKSSKATDRVTCRRCIPRKEGFTFGLRTHRAIGHFKSVDSLKLHIHESTFWLGMDTNCRQVALECPECKHFGTAHHNALLHPIQCSRLFSSICGDYISLPKGFSGHSKAGLFVDVYSGFVWTTC